MRGWASRDRLATQRMLLLQWADRLATALAHRVLVPALAAWEAERAVRYVMQAAVGVPAAAAAGDNDGDAAAVGAATLSSLIDAHARLVAAVTEGASHGDAATAATTDAALGALVERARALQQHAVHATGPAPHDAHQDRALVAALQRLLDQMAATPSGR
jgi:hypothetical protein